MPKRTDLKKIMIIGSGPIVIGQACEFDYSGSQAAKALKSEGYEVILVNSNPATIMTDPVMADRTYIEPLTLEIVADIIARERPDALLPTLGGQTGLNMAVALTNAGVLDQYSTELIGANAETIKKAESRELFRECMQSINVRVPQSGICRNMEEVRHWGKLISFPIIIRPAFTMGGMGGGVAYNMEDLELLAAQGLAVSLNGEILVEESVLGWKEIELELIRDKKDNCIIVCSIENFDPMGVHTGDSIAVAPAQTISDLEMHALCEAGKAIIRAIGMEAGGSNVQFAVHPENGEYVVIEINPRVSRSSALASKATGIPIAKISTKLAVGYTLDEIPNDVTGITTAAFEPSVDYHVVKIPRFTFEKFSGSEDLLTTSMKSVGETMSIGRTFKQALQKGLRSLEIGVSGLTAGPAAFQKKEADLEDILQGLRTPHSLRLFTIRQAILAGLDDSEIYAASAIDPWFINQIRQILDFEEDLRNFGLSESLNPTNPHLAPVLFRAKSLGFSDRQLAVVWKRQEEEIRTLRKQCSISPTYYLVDTCAGEFAAKTPYYYSTYERPCEPLPKAAKKVIILGGGPNRIGQGIEFDYCCCHASFALQELGFESIMINSNPETVSTDFDSSTRLYFEPLTMEDVLEIIEIEQPEGVIVQFGGQTPLNLAVPLLRAGVHILGTSPESIDRAEDRERFQALLHKLQLRQPPNGTALNLEEARTVAAEIGYPVVVRPSYVLGGRAMEVVHDDEDLGSYFRRFVQVTPEHPILIDKFLVNAIEVDVDALSDGQDTYVAGIMEHIEEAGIHSGDSACILPPHSLSQEIQKEIERQTMALASELNVVGLMNIQFAVKGDLVYILEVNPRASRTAPFVSKATGVPLAALATKVMLGASLADLNPEGMRRSGFYAAKEAVFPFMRFPGVDILLGPEMLSTGEVMGLDQDASLAFMKSQLAAGQRLPAEGTVLFSLNDQDKRPALPAARIFNELGFSIVATKGTAQFLQKEGIPAEVVNKVTEGRPNIIDHIKNSEVDLVVNTVSGKKSIEDSKKLRQTALLYGLPYSTTVAGALAAAEAIKAVKTKPLEVKSLQEYYQE